MDFECLVVVGDGSVRVPAAMEIDSRFDDALQVDVAAIPATETLKPG